MKKVYREFYARDGRRVILRTPRMGDLDDFLEFINSLVDEGADILVYERKSREAEASPLDRVRFELAG